MRSRVVKEVDCRVSPFSIRAIAPRMGFFQYTAMMTIDINEEPS